MITRPIQANYQLPDTDLSKYAGEKNHFLTAKAGEHVPLAKTMAPNSKFSNNKIKREMVCMKW